MIAITVNFPKSEIKVIAVTHKETYFLIYIFFALNINRLFYDFNLWLLAAVFMMLWPRSDDELLACLDTALVSVIFPPTTNSPRLLSLHSRQFLTAHVQTSLRHCLRIPPLDMFFSASNSAKLRLDANTRTSAMANNLWRKERLTWCTMIRINISCLQWIIKYLPREGVLELVPACPFHY